MSDVISEVLKNSIEQELEFEKGVKIIYVNNTQMLEM